MVCWALIAGLPGSLSFNTAVCEPQCPIQLRYLPSPRLQALLRNVYSLDERKGDDAVLLARYVRRELACLTMTPSEAVMAGNLRFSAEGLAAAAEEAAAASSRAEGAAAGAEAVPSA